MWRTLGKVRVSVNWENIPCLSLSIFTKGGLFSLNLSIFTYQPTDHLHQHDSANGSPLNHLLFRHKPISSILKPTNESIIWGYLEVLDPTLLLVDTPSTSATTRFSVDPNAKVGSRWLSGYHTQSGCLLLAHSASWQNWFSTRRPGALPPLMLS
jgi:hypothetical protein